LFLYKKSINFIPFGSGSTGAGKTCTMIGNEGVGPGVMVLTMRDIFKQIEERKETKVQYMYIFISTL
jgi:hypothetical protein